jgi:hypothetical protein
MSPYLARIPFTQKFSQRQFASVNSGDHHRWGITQPFSTNHQVQAFLAEVAPAVVGIPAAVSLARSGLNSTLSFGVASVALLLILGTKLHPVDHPRLQIAVVHSFRFLT